MHQSFPGAAHSLDDVLHVHLGHVFTVRVCDLFLLLHRRSRRLRLLLFLLPDSWSVKCKRLHWSQLERTHLLFFLLLAVLTV